MKQFRRYPILAAVETIDNLSLQELLVIAQNTSSPKLLSRLSNIDDDSLKGYVVCNSNTPEQVLRKFANDPSYKYKHLILFNPNVPKDIVTTLINTLSYEQIAVAALNTKVPTVLEALSKHPDFWLRAQAALSLHTPEHVLQAMAAHDTDKGVREAALRTLKKINK